MRIDAFSIQVHVRAAQINDGANPKVSLAYELHRPLLTPDSEGSATLRALLASTARPVGARGGRAGPHLPGPTARTEPDRLRAKVREQEQAAEDAAAAAAAADAE